MTRRLRPTADIYEDAILVGDPGRAMAVAQALIEDPRMCNHARGLWGYSGRRTAGQGLTVQSTGMGGPSAALVLSELAELGVRNAVRVGSATSLRRDLAPGDVVEVREARPWTFAGDGAGPPVYPDEDLAARLRSEFGDEALSGSVASLDAPHRSPDQITPSGDAADMQTATLLATARELGVALAVVLVITDAEKAEPLDDETLIDHSILAAGLASRALFRDPPVPPFPKPKVEG